MSDQPHPVRILAALERRPSAWTRTGLRSIEHASLRVRLTRGTTLVHIEHIVPGRAPEPIKAAPATLVRITDLLTEWLLTNRGPDGTAWNADDDP
jgi:hypothetical protein